MGRITCSVLGVAAVLALTGCKPALTCDGTHSCPNMTMEKKLKNLDNGFSGMVRLDRNNYLVVHDYKNYPGDLRGRRLGIINKNFSGLSLRYEYRNLVNLNHHLHIEGWPRVTKADSGGVANDLESACALSGHANQFLVAESSTYDSGKKKVGGRLFRVTLTPDLRTYEVAQKTEKLPGISPYTHDRTNIVHSRIKESSLENYEGLACWQRQDGKYIVLLGERGATFSVKGSGPFQAYDRVEGSLQWAVFDPSSNTYDWKTPINGIEAPGMHVEGEPRCWRDISGLHIDAERKIWATATYDSALDDITGDEPCNNDNTRPVDSKAYSVMYLLGAICKYKGDRVLSNGSCLKSTSYPRPVVLDNFAVNRKIDGYKIEAIAAPQGNGMLAFTLASEDETDNAEETGGSWWNRPSWVIEEQPVVSE